MKYILAIIAIAILLTGCTGTGVPMNTGYLNYNSNYNYGGGYVGGQYNASAMNSWANSSTRRTATVTRLTDNYYKVRY